ncbi:hypothetical protein J2X02_003810 [Pseudoxanthomonas japonensis]|uniref:hypothetical protein n=1 Tax=Pseudoxanthomonas japonensis TaxID=69284 RepID=UPI002862DFEC|nr:hypothetical protein [Pseudoxanthomonas japonensis]MDR7070938.1 hypothetical protein [Pseudoxanthomonas japonensis]
MEFEEFVSATCEILVEDGFPSYLPTLFVDNEFIVIDDIPESISDVAALSDSGRKYGLDKAGSFFAVLAEPGVVVAGERTPDNWHFVQLQSSPDDVTVVPTGRPAWFRVEA